VFTDIPLAGNPLAVVHDADALDDASMLAFARETRLSETTFVQSANVSGADYRNRIFSPADELPFAGHPSLGTAVAVARTQGISDRASFVQQTVAGLQRVDVELYGDRASASMAQELPVFGDELEAEPLLAVLHLSPADAEPELPPQVVATGLPHVMLPLKHADSLGRIRSDPSAVDAVLAAHDAYGIYAAWCEPERGRARARLFGRSAQVAEDPATGSAAGPLCAYLHRRSGCTALEISQGVEIGRPSVLRAEIADDRVRVSGDVVVVIEGVVRL
jgi:trans-2,3-dihydro-3-hydroxyanthranilate isomerase